MLGLVEQTNKQTNKQRHGVVNCRRVPAVLRRHPGGQDAAAADDVLRRHVRHVCRRACTVRRHLAAPRLLQAATSAQV